ncbi:MAG: beta-propeller domain-containing protein [Oscillospiraceae bacterium]|nr:beta-propeller domain-containing protein [Oscillospiraceae bacterium]
MDAKTFLIEVRKLNFSGREFLEIIGNSKISNSVYNEIKGSSGLTFERLVELLEGSPLESDDYTRLLSDASALVKHREKDRRQSEEKLERALKESQKRLEEQERARNAERAAELLAEAKRKAREQYIAETQGGQTAREISVAKEIPAVQEITAAREIPQARDNGAYKVNVDFSEDEDGAESETSDVTAVSDDFNHSADSDNSDDYYNPDEYTEYEDYEQDDGETYEGAVQINHSDNKPKLILCFCMAIALICTSFVLRYFYTGSFFIESEENVNFEVPETYYDLSQRLIKAGDYVSLTPQELSPEKNYRLADEENQGFSKKLLFNDRYIFNIIENKLYVIEINNGAMTKIASIELGGRTTREIFLYGNKLYAIFEGEYRGEYSHDINDGNETLDYETAAPETLSGSFAQKTVTVRVYDALDFSDTPELEFTVDGELFEYSEYNSTFLYKNKPVIVTNYTPHEPEAHSDLAAFVPSYTVNTGVPEKSFVAIDNIYAPPARLMNTEMTVISIIDGNKAEVFAVVGGRGSVYAGETALFVTQTANAGDSRSMGNLRNSGFNSRLIKLDETGSGESVYYDFKGVIPGGAVDERAGIVRVGVNEGGGSALYVLNSQLELISRVINIGTGASNQQILFDSERAYFISDKLYAFNTAIPDDIIPAVEPFPNIYSDDFYKISNRERLEIAIELDDEGRRAGIRLNVHKSELSETPTAIAATYLITAESGVAGNWNPFLFTDAETDRDAVLISREDGIIIIPVTYSNSISNIEKIIVFDYNEFAGLVKRGEIVYYDINKESRRAVLIDGYIYSFWDTLAVSIDETALTVVQKLEL